MQFVERVPWIESYGIDYFVGIDGFSLLLVMLTTFLMPLAVLASWESITERLREYMIFMLLLETGMLGVFVSLDLFLFYVFWEAMLIPMYFLIGGWGGEYRIYAAVKFFIYTMFGSLLMLVGILVLYWQHYQIKGTLSFDLLQLYTLSLAPELQRWLFLAFFLSFAIKVPLFPFHTWLPDAHVEAPTAGSVILAGVLLKMGVYGFLRFSLPLFPQATLNAVPYIIVLAIIGIIYGALVAMVQPDIKKLVAYSSVSHLGFVVLGIFALTAQGVSGGLLQMVNHGLSTGALFVIVGMLYDRRHTRLISAYGGLTKVLPVLAGFFMVITLSSIGLPGLNGFVGEFLILVGTFRVYPMAAVFAALGVILAAVYMLWMFQRVMFGQVTHEENRHLSDLSGREIALLLPLVLLILWIGIYPQPFLQRTEMSTQQLLERVATATKSAQHTPAERQSGQERPLLRVSVDSDTTQQGSEEHGK
jgi:NADH-quinone oxidoreductase subunit M